MQRTCARCGIRKPLDEFGGGSPANPKTDCYCRPCRAEYGRLHYLANRQRYVEKAKQRTDALRERNYALGPLSARPPVRRLRRARRPGTAILAGIEKCDVVCANCHRRRTAKRGGFARYVAAPRHGALADARDDPAPQ